MPAVSFTVDALSNAAEGGASGEFRVTAHGDTADFTNAVYAIWNMFGTATSGTDYSNGLTPGSYLVFTAPAATATVTITAVDDGDEEGVESVGLTVQRYEMVPTGPTASDSLSLYDNDTAPPPPVVTVTTVADAVEGGTHGVFQFSRTGDTTAALTVTYTVQTGGSPNATPGEDYETLTGTVTIAAGYATATVQVVAGIDLIDPDEVVSVEVTSTSEYTVGSASTAQCDIVEDLTDPAIRTQVLNLYYAQLLLAQSTLTGTIDYADTLTALQERLDEMTAADLQEQLAAYETALSQYATLDLTRGSQILDVYAKATEIINGLNATAALAENDAYRLRALEKQGDELRAYLNARLDQLADLRAGLSTLFGLNTDSRLESYDTNLALDEFVISGLLSLLDEVEYESDTTSTDPRVVGDETTTGLNELAGYAEDALSELDTRTAAAALSIGEIFDLGLLILVSPAGMQRDQDLYAYSYDHITPLADGNGSPGLGDYLQAPVDDFEEALQDAIELANEIAADVGVQDELRIAGLQQDLDRAKASLDSMKSLIDGLYAQVEQISNLYGFPEGAECLNAKAKLTNIRTQIDDLLLKISNLQEALTGAP